jgi:alkanesulfonate monooxygenase SsuD/methylene tetrahydromethanopterin reductase-like flavin-dependent oxidoreductase (luciferase family)
MFSYVTDERAESDEVLTFLAGVLRRPAVALRDRFLVGPANQCIEKIQAYSQAGAQRILLWPVRNELRQLELFKEGVGPHV